MNKFAVFDKVNKQRLLGHLSIAGEIRGYSYRAAVFDSVDLRHLYLSASAAQETMNERMDTVNLDLEVRQTSHAKQIDTMTREITTIERKVLETDASLSTLMKLKDFTLPDESERSAYHRRRDAGFYN